MYTDENVTEERLLIRIAAASGISVLVRDRYSRSSVSFRVIGGCLYLGSVPWSNYENAYAEAIVAANRGIE